MVNRFGNLKTGDTAALLGKQRAPLAFLLRQADLIGGRELVKISEAPGARGRAMAKEGVRACAPQAGNSAPLHRAGGELREIFGLPARLGPAERPDRTGEAQRIMAKTDGGAQLHHGLIMIAGTLGWEERVRQRREGLGGGGGVAIGGRIGRQASEDADDIAINAGGGRGETDAGDSGGGIRTDPGKFLPFARSCWRSGAGRNFPSEAVEVANARIIAEPLPEF